MNTQKLKIFTWHVHGSYLYYLTQADCEFYIPVEKDRQAYGGRAGTFPWGENVHEIPTDKVKDLDIDLILYQSKENYLKDQYDTLSETQRKLPKLYLEHDPPREQPTGTKHIVTDSDITIVHVTHFNELMWDNNNCPTKVIDHGVVIPNDVAYSGEIEKGIVVINNIKSRGRRLGYDIFEKVREIIPIDIVGMGSKEIGGLGEIPPHKIPEFVSHYRFFFNPIRYTSLGLSVCEAMMVGMPIIGLATTEMVTAVENGMNGFVYTDLNKVIESMKSLLKDKRRAEKLSSGSKEYANKRFNIRRFTKDWEQLFREKINESFTKKSKEQNKDDFIAFTNIAQ